MQPQSLCTIHLRSCTSKTTPYKTTSIMITVNRSEIVLIQYATNIYDNMVYVILILSQLRIIRMQQSSELSQFIHRYGVLRVSSQYAIAVRSLHDLNLLSNNDPKQMVNMVHVFR